MIDGFSDDFFSRVFVFVFASHILFPYAYIAGGSRWSAWFSVKRVKFTVSTFSSVYNRDSDKKWFWYSTKTFLEI